MKRKLTMVIALTLIMGLGGCSLNNMTDVAAEDEIIAARPGKALIHFLRPNSLFGGVPAAIYTGNEYIGTIWSRKRISYEAEPGEHMFMITAESADFLQANLQAGKVYYALVQPRFGAWTARFSLRPMNGQIPLETIDTWMEKSRQVVVSESGQKWAIRNQEKALRLKEKYLPVWHEKLDANKQILHAESGR